MSGSNPKAAGAGSTAGPRGLLAGKEEKKKAGGGVLNRLKARRQAPHHAADDGLGAAVTEQELLALDAIRPEHVLRLSRVTESECGAAAPSPRAGPRAPCSLQRSPPLARPGVRPATFPSPAGQAALPPRHPDLVGKGLPLSVTAFPRVWPHWQPLGRAALRPGRSPPQLHLLGWGPLSLTGSSGPW